MHPERSGADCYCSSRCPGAHKRARAAPHGTIQPRTDHVIFKRRSFKNKTPALFRFTEKSTSPMTCYFMRDTPLFQLERQMMTSPNFKLRGHGRYYPGFQYGRDDMGCPYCMNFRRNHPCPLEQCVCLDERIVAGAIDLNEFVRDCFFSKAGVQLRARLEQNFNCSSISFFLSDSHRERWQHWRERCFRMPNRNLAALFLLTAYGDIWRRMICKFDASGFDFQSVQLAVIQPELYCVYQAAKAISTGSRADLTSPELVTDEAFHLIVCALLLAKYGDVILNFERKKVMLNDDDGSCSEQR